MRTQRLLWLLVMAACGDDGGDGSPDGGSPPRDAGEPDVGARPDAEPEDAGAPMEDAAEVELDAAPADDAGGDDAGLRDASTPDAGEPDAGPSDAGAVADGGPMCMDVPDAGGTFTCERATTCSGDLSSVGTSDFSIAFRITTTTTIPSGVISQRAICMHSHFWDIRMTSAALGVELDDPGGVYTSFTAPVSLTDGEPHDVEVCRKTGRVGVFVDGCLVTLVDGATNLSGLSPLTIGTTTCTALDGTQTLDGTVDNVCVGALP